MVGGAEFGEFPVIDLANEELFRGWGVLGEGGEWVVGSDGVHGGAVSAVAEGFEGDLVAGVFEVIVLEACVREGHFLLPAELGFLEEELVEFGGGFIEEGLDEFAVAAVLELEEGVFEGVFF